MEYYNELYHYGIKGMKWGIRRYQNKDGSLTNAGKKRVRDANSSGMYFYDVTPKNKKYPYPVRNRKAVNEKERLRQAYDDYVKVSIQERDRLLKERTTLKKAGYNFTKKLNDDIIEHNNDIMTYVLTKQPAMRKSLKRYTEVELDLFADATIADLELKNTDKTKTFIKNQLISSSKLTQRNLGLLDETDE